MLRVTLGGTLFVLLCGGLAADDKKADAIDAKKLVGKWLRKEKVAGPTVVMEFTKDGKATLTLGGGGKDIKLAGTYKVDGDKLTTTTNLDGQEKSQTDTILKLTDDELVLRSARGNQQTLTRVKGK
jgi:uncharacterized protein (TIGR03066 family)